MACAGSESPSPDPDLARAIAATYGSGQAAASAGASGNIPTPPSSPENPADDPDEPAAAAGSGGAGGAADQPPDDGTAGSGGANAEEPEAPAEVPAEPACDGFSIIAASCGQGGCHGQGSNLGNFAESEDIARTFIGRDARLTCAGSGAIIDPENPSGSVLVLKLSDDPPCGNYMPPSAQFLSADEVACIEDWMGSL